MTHVRVALKCGEKEVERRRSFYLRLSGYKLDLRIPLLHSKTLIGLSNVVRESARGMNDLSNAVRDQHEHHHCWSCEPIPTLAICVLVPVFFIGIGVSIFILVVVHNAAFFVSLLSLSAIVAAFLLWNAVNWSRNGALLSFLRAFPDSDLRLALDGQLVKVTGAVMCGSVSLESSYEKASRCIYTSTVLYQYGELKMTLLNANIPCFRWRLAYAERFSTDFFITDNKSSIRALVKAGPDCKVIPLIPESRLVNTTRNCITLSAHLRKWLRERNLSAEGRLLRLEEGHLNEGSLVTVIGLLRRTDGTITIVQPPALISTGCFWRKLLLPVDVDGLILGTPVATSPLANQDPVLHLQH